jgi:hypothetical protein
VARFYEGLILPHTFALENSPYAGGRLSSTTDPNLSTDSATLPVVTGIALQFGRQNALRKAGFDSTI